MNKKILVLSLLWILLPLLILGSTRSAFGANVPIGTPGHYIDESIGDPETVDPAWAYDTASGALIANIYETLIEFNREYFDAFKPALSTQVPSLENGLIEYIDEPAPHGLFNWQERITFPIREGVRFHSGDTLTVEDVEYSFERWMVQDRAGGPEWMIYEAVEGIGYYHAGQITSNRALQAQVIDQAFQHDGNNFIMNLAVRYNPIMGILAQFWGAIVNESFMATVPGEWDHDWSTWWPHHAPGEAPVDAAGHVADGTGPFALGYDFGDGPGYWTVGVEWSVVRFPDYWGGWPAPGASSYLNRMTEKVVYEWGTRLADFRAGTTDVAYVPRQYISQVEGWPGIRGLKDLPSLTGDGMFFNFDVDPASPYVGTGVLGSGGIPLNFFSDIHIRKGFAYVFNYTKFIEEVWLGEAVQPSSCVIEGILYHNATIPLYYMDITKARAEFQAASDTVGGPAEGVMTKGFYFKMTYNTGNQPRQVTTEMIKTNLKLVNPLFNVETLGVTWSTYLGELWWYPSSRSVMPVYHIGWIADYPDPHNWVMPFMHTDGDFSYPSSYSNSTVDELIEEGIALPNGPDRKAVYDTLQLMYYQDIPNVMIEQPLGRRWERNWVQGWYYNTIDSPRYYYRWEGLNGDIAGDGDVDAQDWTQIISVYWYDPPEIAGPYNPKADVGPWPHYVLGLLPEPTSVGTVDTLDLAVLNAHWAEVAV